MIQAGRRRLRPIMMTAVTGDVSFGAAPGSGLQMPAAIGNCVLGGILISTVLPLLITPAANSCLGGKDEAEQAHS